MRPHVTGRVLALVRCPEGAEGQCFFQKHARLGIPTEFLHLVQEEGEKIISIDNLDGLIALVQGGVLEVHVRGSAVDDRERANRLVFDLDPGPGVDFADVVDAAREVRARLRRIKLTSFVKTTGGKGLHVVVPIKPAPWDDRQELLPQGRAQHGEGRAPSVIVSILDQKPAPQPHLRRLSAQQPRGDRDRALLHPRAAGRAGGGAGRDWSELGAIKGGQPVHREERDAAHGANWAQGSLGRHGAQPAGAAEIQMKRPAIWRAFRVLYDDTKPRRAC